MKKICLLILIAFSFQNCTKKTPIQQNCPGNSPFWGLNCFLSTAFMEKFHEAKIKAEQSVRDVKRLDQTEVFPTEDMEAVAYAYNTSANSFNDILYKIKADLLTKEKRKQICLNPDSYGSQIEVKLKAAKRIYANTYQKEVTQLTNGQITGSAFLILLPQVIKYSKLAFGLYKKIQAEMAKYNENLIDKYLIEPNQFQAWEDIQ